jgi:hypothetical protein
LQWSVAGDVRHGAADIGSNGERRCVYGDAGECDDRGV